MLCAFGCGSKHESKESDPLAQYRDTLIGNFNGLQIDTLICESKESDNLAQYRDMLIGNFNGLQIDTLICEPMDSINSDDKEFYYRWRVFTKNKTVKDLIFENITIGIHFVKEGDLDGNGTDEWGFVNEWPTSNLMGYHAFTNLNGEWQYIIEPTSI